MSEIQMKKIRMDASFGRGMRILVSVVLSGAFSILCLLLVAVLMTATELSEMTTLWLVGLITYASVFLAGLISGWGAERRGWLHGAISAVVYLALVRLLGWISMKSGGMMGLISALIPGILVGALGGILGINLGRRSRR